MEDSGIQRPHRVSDSTSELALNLRVRDKGYKWFTSSVDKGPSDASSNFQTLSDRWELCLARGGTRKLAN